MRATEARELFRQLTARYFAGATVTFSNQSRVAKPRVPLVTITPGIVRRPTAANYSMTDDEVVGHYLSRITFQVDLFTHGAPVVDDETGETVAYENTAMDDMLSFADFLNSDYAIRWCHVNDVSILIDGDVQDLTGVVNDTNYEYRARMSVLFYFTQKAVGPTAVLKESSIQYPDGEGGYTPETPLETESPTNGYETGAMKKEEAAIVEPEFEQTSSGGGTEELAKETTGYFTEVEIKEEKANE